MGLCVVVSFAMILPVFLPQARTDGWMCLIFLAVFCAFIVVIPRPVPFAKVPRLPEEEDLEESPNVWIYLSGKNGFSGEEDDGETSPEVEIAITEEPSTLGSGRGAALEGVPERSGWDNFLRCVSSVVLRRLCILLVFFLLDAAAMMNDPEADVVPGAPLVSTSTSFSGRRSCADDIPR